MNYFTIFLLVVSIFEVNSVMFLLQPNRQKCLRGEVKKNELIMASYEVSEAPKQAVDFRITDSKGEMVATGQDIKTGRNPIVFDVDETYEICFRSRVNPEQRGVPHEISFSTKLEVKPFEKYGEALKLKPMELDLKKLEQLSHSIVVDFESMREREIKMSNTNESTNNRVIYFSFFGVFVLFCLSAWQVYYLRKYFKSRKLIE